MQAMIQLHIKRGARMVAVTPEQASNFLRAKRDKAELAGRGGASRLGGHPVSLFNSEGVQVGYVSYNGRVWLAGVSDALFTPTYGVTYGEKPAKAVVL